jgi:hypothetical protein
VPGACPAPFLVSDGCPALCLVLSDTASGGCPSMCLLDVHLCEW